MAKTISIVNQKGGVGKTTTSVNLSAALANMGFRTLLIDLDPQGHSTEHIGLSGNFHPTKTVLEIILKEEEISDVIKDTYLDKLHIIPTNLRLGLYNQNSPEGKQFNLKESIESVDPDYDYIIIDCQPSLSLLTLNALTASDYIVLPVQSEFLALDGLTQLIKTLKEVRIKLNPALSVLGVVLTMYDKRNKLSGEIRNELAKNFGDDLFETIIPRSVRFAEAPSFGKAIFDYAPRSKGASAYRQLAEEMLIKLADMEQ